MAGNGFSFVDAINELVETIGEFPMTGSAKPSVAGDTTSTYYRAEQFIDRYTRRVLARGWPENTVYSKSYTPVGAGFEVALAGSVLGITPAGATQSRPIVMRVDTTPNPDVVKLFDTRLNSFNLGSSDAVVVDQVELLPFEDLPTQLQDVIIDEAKTAFQRRLQGNLNMDTVLQSEQAKSEMLAPRNDRTEGRLFNPIPLVPAPPRKGDG